MKTIEIPAELCGNQHVYRQKTIEKWLLQNRDILLNGEVNNEICYDGIVDERVYSQQKFRLAFLLKETNGNTPKGEKPKCYKKWDYVGWIRKKQSTGEEALYPTFRNIAMWTAEFCDIFECGETNKAKYLDAGALQINAQLREGLRKIAVINLKKTFGGGSTEWKALDAYLTQDICDVLREEIAVAEPTVVLCGGQQVFDLVRRIHRMESCRPLTIETPGGRLVEYIPAWDMVYVNFYHPACRKSREAMFDFAADVFAALKKLLNR